MHFKKLVPALALTVAITGCTTNPYTGESQTSKGAWGALAGAATGAAVGALSSSKGDRKKGILTGAQKSQLRHKVVCSLAFGSRRLYETVDRNSLFSFAPMDVVCQPATIAAQFPQFKVHHDHASLLASIDAAAAGFDGGR